MIMFMAWHQMGNKPSFEPMMTVFTDTHICIWFSSVLMVNQGLTLSIWFTCPSGTDDVVIKIYVPWKSFHVPSQYLYKPCKAYVYCWKNKYMPTLKNHMPCRACNHKNLCALGQNLYATGMRARLNVEPCKLWYLQHNCIGDTIVYH